MKKCPFCSSSNKDSILFCESCGKSTLDPPSIKVIHAPSKPFMKLSKLKIALIAAAVIFLVLITVLVPSACSANRAADLAALPKESLSSDQQRLLAMAGYPEEFVIIFDEGNANIRTETWVYEDMERYFAFQGGAYTGGEEITSPELKDDKYKIGPKDFVYALSPADVTTLIGSKGNEYIDETTGLKVIIYGDGLIICSFSPEDALMGVSRTRNIIPGGE